MVKIYKDELFEISFKSKAEDYEINEIDRYILLIFNFPSLIWQLHWHL
jgi:hypothetical protein